MNQASALAGVFFYASGCHNGSRSFFIKKVSYLFVQTSSSPPLRSEGSKKTNCLQIGGIGNE